MTKENLSILVKQNKQTNSLQSHEFIKSAVYALEIMSPEGNWWEWDSEGTTT